MSPLGRILSFFPAFHGALSAAALFHLIHRPGALALGVFIGVLYLLPPLLHRVHCLAYPIREGLSRISDPGYSPWWGSHQLQLLFVAYPALETWMTFIPGLYSAWLRLWGAKIGRAVYWTPHVEVIDRSLIEIGDRVILGHKFVTCSHVIKPGKGGSLILYVKTIRVGNDVFIGAVSRLGPGSSVPDGSVVPFNTDVSINEVFGQGDA